MLVEWLPRATLRCKILHCMSDTPQVLSACPGQLSKVHLQSCLAVTHPPKHVFAITCAQCLNRCLMFTTGTPPCKWHTTQCNVTNTAHRRHVSDARPAIVVVASGMHAIASETTMATTAIPCFYRSVTCLPSGKHTGTVLPWCALTALQLSMLHYACRSLLMPRM